jgi:hypothetical protein
MSSLYNHFHQIPELVFFTTTPAKPTVYPDIYFRVGWTIYVLRYGASEVIPVVNAPNAPYKTVKIVPSIYGVSVEAPYKSVPKTTQKPTAPKKLIDVSDAFASLFADRKGAETPQQVSKPRVVTFNYRKRDAYGRFIVAQYVIDLVSENPTHIYGNDHDEDGQFKAFVKENIVGQKIQDVVF